MTKTQKVHAGGSGDRNGQELDVLVIGGGVAGIHALYALQKLGVRVRLAERGHGVGGVWYWNRYPGSRFDSDSISYGYFFDDALAEDWQWSEHFAGQPEIERYYNFIVDRYDLRQHIYFQAEVTGTKFDTESNRWAVEFADGAVLTTRFVVMATGMLSQPYFPPVEGMDDFKGTLVHTGQWPAEGIDLAGKRVAVIGTGSSGIQVIPAAASVAESVIVFQRGGHWSTPLNNRPITAEEQQEFRDHFRRVHAKRQSHPGGFIHEPDPRSALEVSEEERVEQYEKIYSSMGLRSLTSNFADTLTNPESNKLYTDFVADKIRARVNDPELAERLIPKDHGYGTHRPPKDTGYFETFNRDNVELVSLKDTPIKRYTATGIETSEREYEFDIIVLATGFNPWLGALKRIDIRGVSGRNLVERYSTNGPCTNLGVLVPDYPNLFFVGGLHSIAGNAPASIESHVNFVTDLVRYAKDGGFTRLETTEDAAIEWTDYVYESDTKGQMIAKGSWYTGANVEGGPRFKTLIYEGGLPNWERRAREIIDSGLKGISCL